MLDGVLHFLRYRRGTLRSRVRPLTLWRVGPDPSRWSGSPAPANGWFAALGRNFSEMTRASGRTRLEALWNLWKVRRGGF